MTLVLWLGLAMQSPPPAQSQKKKPEIEEELPPEEDVSAKPKEYSFNPLQALNEMKVGNYYMKRGKFRAAALRFKEATLWNNGLAEGYERLGAAQEKSHDKKAAREAYAKYLEVAPEAKDADEIRKKLKKL